MITELLRDPPIETESEITVAPSQSTNRPAPPPQQPVGLSEADQQRLYAIIENRCVECHNADEATSGFDLTQYPQFTAKQKFAVSQSLLGKGPSGKAMPLNGEPLSGDEMTLFFLDYNASNK